MSFDILNLSEEKTMKKIISALLSLGLILSLCACGDDKKDDANKPASSAETTNVASEEPKEFPIPEGEHAEFMLSYAWAATDNSGSISFYSDGKFDYFTSVTNDDGSVTTGLDSSGHWNIDEDDELELTFENGVIEYCGTQNNSFYVAELDKTFSNGEVEGLDNWYGTYIGELGEINISESIFDTSIDVDIYLDDEIGSMYSTSLKLELTGEIASDEYIQLVTDGETVTLESLDSQFDNYVGEYTKQ
jgi:hypothetical protein